MKKPIIADVLRYRLDHRSKASETKGWTDPETGIWTACMEWQGSCNGEGGYGRLWNGERLEYVHRMTWRLAHGAVPVGKDVMHRCDNPPCRELGHLKCGTEKENTADMIAKGRHLVGRAVAAMKRKGRASAIRGALHPRSKLTTLQAIEIKGRLSQQTDKRNRPASLAREFGVSDSLIRAIRDGRGWAHLP